jgi:hypothetical protein
MGQTVPQLFHLPGTEHLVLIGAMKAPGESMDEKTKMKG